MKAKHAEKRPKITISLWLFITIIAVMVLLIVGITYYSVQRELNANNSNNTTSSVAQTTEQAAASQSAGADRQEVEKTTAVSQQEEEDSSVQPTTEAIAVSGAESADEELYFSAELYPYKAFDTVGNRNASVKEVFGSIYSGEGLTFDENGLFADNITQSEYNYGAYTVTDGVINMTYSNDKNATAQIISYEDGVPSEIVIDFVGYEVYFKVGSAE